jgi:hypothetical protein
MIVNFRYGFVFIKTIKTAGTSIEICLSKYCDKNDILTYLPGPDEKIRQELGYQGPANAFHGLARRLFGKLRGQQKLERTFRYHHNTPAREARGIVGEEFWNRAVKITAVRNPFDRAISKFYHDHRHAAGETFSRDQVNGYILALKDSDLTNWHIYAEGDQILTDTIIRYEELAKGTEAALRRVGITDPVKLPHAKGGFRTNRDPYSTVLGSEARARIEAAAGKEIEAFGYRWQSGA